MCGVIVLHKLTRWFSWDLGFFKSLVNCLCRATPRGGVHETLIPLIPGLFQESSVSLFGNILKENILVWLYRRDMISKAAFTFQCSPMSSTDRHSIFILLCIKIKWNAINIYQKSITLWTLGCWYFTCHCPLSIPFPHVLLGPSHYSDSGYGHEAGNRTGILLFLLAMAFCQRDGVLCIPLSLQEVPLFYLTKTVVPIGLSPVVISSDTGFYYLPHPSAAQNAGTERTEWGGSQRSEVRATIPFPSTGWNIVVDQTQWLQ